MRPSPGRLFAMVPMCTLWGQEKTERPGNVQQTLRKNAQKGEITESPELESQNENKNLSVPALSPSKYREYFNCLPNTYPACLYEDCSCSVARKNVHCVCWQHPLLGSHLNTMTLTAINWAPVTNYSQKSNYVFNNQCQCIIMRACSLTT